jgi:unsaturated rhamnogalacturonyl hydrolase
LAVFASLLLNAALAALLLADAAPVFLHWIRRIHIGRWSSAEAWQEKVFRQTLLQWKRLPAIPISDQNHLTLLKRLCGQYSSPALQFWHGAALQASLGLPPRQKECPEKIAAFSSVSAGVYANARLLFDGPPDENGWLSVFAQSLLNRAGAGTLPYAENICDLRLVDSLWMVCPFLFRYAAHSGDARYAALSKRQLAEYLARGIHPETGLPVHSFAEANAAPLGVYGWGRGCGFLLLALSESLEAAGDPADRAWLRERAIEAAQTMLRYQTEGGGWSHLFLASNRPESSATALLGTALAILVQELPEEQHESAALFLQRAKAARDCLMRMTRRSGAVDFAQGDTHGIGQYSTRFEPLPLAQAYTHRLAQILGKIAI